jgi:hypothetical protein
MSAAADRAVYAVLYWARRRNGGAILQVAAGLTDDDRVDVIWLLRNCDHLNDLTDTELRRRMLGAAAAPPEIF